MGRNRVLSLMSSLSNRDGNRNPRSTSPTTMETSQKGPNQSYRQEVTRQEIYHRETDPPQAVQQQSVNSRNSPQMRPQRERASSRPMSMVQTYQPPLMELNQDTLPELQPIFTYLNSHGNKLYQEGYFLKLNDQDTQGRPNTDRSWTECFAQLVGTVLSLWDAAELDTAGQDGEVLPKFINLTDASIKMIEAVPTRSKDDQPLQNVLSISTAGRNRYLLHFNSHHSLIQWTAGIRLAMYEHATLQEAYTGALIGGKGKLLNNINYIMDRSRVRHEDWVRVRFGAGTPWRRCWCVVVPPDEKEYQRVQKELNKKKSAYDRSRPPIIKGCIKFYETKKTKKVRPIATIEDAYSCFAIYPQSKPLIDQSTLVKLEGIITIHGSPPSTTEGFVFVMPEVHPAVSGFEMMLRWLFPVWDTFALYGRPGRLVSDTHDARGLMFAMPKERRYGYLEILDVTTLLLTDGSNKWHEKQWRLKMKELTSRRMTVMSDNSSHSSRNSKKPTRNSLQISRRPAEDGSLHSSPSVRFGESHQVQLGIPRTDSAPPGASGFQPPKSPHNRSVSESFGQSYSNSMDDSLDRMGPLPLHGQQKYRSDMAATPERVSSDDERVGSSTPIKELQEVYETTEPEPVAAPPSFSHAPGTLPMSKPYHSAEMRKANTRMSTATMAHMAGTSVAPAAAGAAVHQLQESGRPRTRDRAPGGYDGTSERLSEDRGQRVVPTDANTNGTNANHSGIVEGLAIARSRNNDHPLPPTPYDEFDANNQYRGSSNSQSNRVSINGTSSSAFPAYSEAMASRSQPTQRQNHNSRPSNDFTPSPLSRSETAQSIARKPLPKPAQDLREVQRRPPTASSDGSKGSLTNHLDQNVIDMITFGQLRSNNIEGRSGPDAQDLLSRQSSFYDDAESTATPDYASTHRSINTTRESIERPRAGVMKTVGTIQDGETAPAPAGSATINGKPEEPIDIPDVDFGPDFKYASQGPRDDSPKEAIGILNKPLPSRPASGQGRRSPEKSTSRTAAWVPSSHAGPPIPGQQGLTPEEFVKARAAALPNMYVQPRQPSKTDVRRDNNATPPLMRNKSGDKPAHIRGNSMNMLQQRSQTTVMQQHSRNNSSDMLARTPRPMSQSPATLMSMTDYPATLSAREQEHVAKITGKPLLSMTDPKRKEDTAASNGLVGAIGAREKEKLNIKQGMNSQTVQQAILQRQQQAQMEKQAYQQQQQQQHAQQQQYDSFTQPNLGTSSPGPYGQVGGTQHAQSQYALNTPGNRNSWAASTVLTPGGGWQTPGYVMTPEQQQQQNYFAGGQNRGQNRHSQGWNSGY